MDLFNRGKSKTKKKPIIDPPLIETTTTTNSALQTSTSSTVHPHSPKSPNGYLNEEHFASGTVDQRFSPEHYFYKPSLGVGRLMEGSSSVRSSQSSSIPSTDSEYTSVDTMTENEIEEFFERMLVKSPFFFFILFIISNSNRESLLL